MIWALWGGSAAVAAGVVLLVVGVAVERYHDQVMARELRAWHQGGDIRQALSAEVRARSNAAKRSRL